MREREAFIEAIAAAPDDDVRRLAFADWLQEHGEEGRAEFVRCIRKLMSRLAESTKPLSWAADCQKLYDRVHELFRWHGEEWFDPFCHALGTRLTRQRSWPARLMHRLFGPLRRTSYTLRYSLPPQGSVTVWDHGPILRLGQRLGFVNYVQLDLGSPLLVRDIGAAFRLEPVNDLYIRPADNLDQWRRVNAPCLARITKLSIEVLHEREPRIVNTVGALLHGRHWSGLSDLRLIRHHCGPPTPPEYVERLADSPILSGLRSLSLCTERPNLLPLTTNPRLECLSTFALSGCRLADDAVGGLIDAVCRPNLTNINLSCNGLDSSSVRRLAAVTWPKLQGLDLGVNAIGDAGARHLMPLVPQLAELTLERCEITDAGALALADAIDPERLRRLDLASCAITDAGALALADAIDPERLESLCLNNNPLSPDAVATLRALFGNRFHFRTAADDAARPY